MAAQKYTGKERRKRMAIKRVGIGGCFYSQVFLPFEEGIPPLPLRKKIINTFAVAMPTSLTLLSAVSIPGRNYPQFKGLP